MLELLLPTLRVTADEVALLKARLPGPVSPPKVAAVSDPKLKIPLPLVSSVLFCKASGLPKASVPPLISVLPAVSVGGRQDQRAAIDLRQAAGAGERTGERHGEGGRIDRGAAAGAATSSASWWRACHSPGLR